MKKMSSFLKNPVILITAVALILVGAFMIARLGAAGNVDGQTPTTGQGQVTGQELADVNAVDVEDEEGAADGAVGDMVEDDPSTLIPSDGIPTIHQKLTWEAINAFPIKHATMSEDERRSLCVDFLRFSKTALWTPKESIKYIRNGSGSSDTMTAGIVYGGLPYVGVASGSVYRTMDWMDEETGVVDISKALTDDAPLSSGVITMEQLKYFGNQCSIGAYWGWARVMNSANFTWTSSAVPKNNFIMLGDYSGYSANGLNDITSWADPAKKNTNINTVKVCKAVGDQQMYKNYALFEKGDGMVQYTTAGHFVMVATDAYVVDTNGNVVTDLSASNLSSVTIDGENSYVTILDQAQSWLDGQNEAGDRYRYKNNVDAKRTFAALFKESYIPYSFDEFHGGAIEETEVTFSHVGSTITKSQLFSAKVTANYGISDIYAIVTDDTGAEVYRHVVRTPKAGNFEMEFLESDPSVDTYGTLNPGTYNVEIVVQLGTGERPTLYVGTLVV